MNDYFCISTSLKQKMSKGSQAFNNYCDINNKSLLKYYGFALMNNIFDYTDVIYLGFDNDEAGSKAKEKSMKLLNSYGIKTMDLSYSPYKDADEFIRNEGVEKFKNLL